MSISELGLIISDELILTVPLLIIFSYLNHFFLGVKMENKPPIKSNYLRIIQWILGITFGILFALFTIKFLNSTKYSYKLFYSSFLLVCLYVFVLVASLNNISSVFPTNMQFYFSLIFVLTFSYIITKTSSNLIMVENGRYFGTKIYTEDSIYTSNISSYYIGKTSSNIFIYNAKDSSTTILPLESIKKIVFKSY
jgi:hypothetical protein